ncbi:hypothetical protein D210916BOD24_01380 [Alteromonas sp. D210916BOD_24]|uniref:flagellar assembly protein T N-terminal domain-containing protein n=1 Tax=Alteromonas sp. D210916BOD_24 TaxID=3157618 RepID=UPI00399D070C
MLDTRVFHVAQAMGAYAVDRLLRFRATQILCCSAVLIGFSANVMAGWVQGEATIALAGADLDDVRQTAIQNAVADAAFQSGGTIFAEEVMVNGLLLSSKAEIRSQGRIQRVEIMSETVKDDQLTVVVNVNITPLFDCENNGLAHRVLVTEFPLVAPEQAATGQLYLLGRHVSQRFTQQLNSLYNPGNVSQVGLALIKPESWLAESLSNEELVSKSTFLRSNYGQQFVIFGFVKDISLFEQVSQASSLFDSDEVALRRNFTIQVYVLDTYQSKIIFNDSYHSEADWTFSSHYTVDINNSLMWRSDYGRMMLNTIHAAVTDIHAALQCQTTYAQVLDITPEYIAIDLGKSSQLQKGDKFLLVKQRGLPELRQTKSVGLFRSEAITLEIDMVSDEVSLLRRTAGTDGIQVGDLVTPLRD